MERSRRGFLKLAGILTLGLGTKPVIGALSGGDEPDPRMMQNEDALTATHWGMVIDTRKIKSSDDLQPIIEACHSIHNVPHLENKQHEIKWIWEESYEHAFPTKENEYLNERIEDLPFLVLCNHCVDPPCCRACPTKATFKRESDGVVLMDFHRCIGCRFCMAACPYGARSFNFRDPRPFVKETNPGYPTRMKGVVEKCNFCAERLAEGKQPACVEASDGILAFGDLDDPDSHVRELLREHYTIRRKQALGTGPSVYYIV
ncbi:MAG: 4Fe-4S dicluster domain-containing protein [Deltaproteobacteria bacterium]|nr:4Fe-4S dicluster domain-containing protein [Deltaproteobacteria bacterium]